MRRREILRLEVRRRLVEALRGLAPGARVILFGSITRPCDFHERSDVDIALLEEPRACSRFQLAARLEEELDRPVDLVILSESRLKDKIEREGEEWTS